MCCVNLFLFQNILNFPLNFHFSFRLFRLFFSNIWDFFINVSGLIMLCFKNAKLYDSINFKFVKA